MNNNPNPSGELSQVAINAPAEIEVPESMMEFAQQFRESMMRYSCAIREVKTKLEVLNDDLSVILTEEEFDSEFSSRYVELEDDIIDL